MADALSRRDAEEATLLAVSAPSFNLLEAFRAAASTDEGMRQMLARLEAGALGDQWKIVDGLITYKNRLFVPATFPLLPEILAAAHDDNHEGVQRTLHRLRRDFHVEHASAAVQEYVRACPVCQRNKVEKMSVWTSLKHYPRLEASL